MSARDVIDSAVNFRRHLKLMRGHLWRLRGHMLPGALRAEANRFLDEHQDDLVFVLGSGRSGTQLITRLLAAQQGVVAFHEPNFVEDVATMDDFRRKPEAALDYWRLFRSVEVYRRWQAEPRARIYAEANGTIRYHQPAIAKLWPRSHQFLLTRNPRGYVRSLMGWKRFYSPGSKGAFGLEPIGDDPYRGRWSGMSRFEKVCWSWVETNALLADRIPERNWLQLEKLVSDYAYCRERLFQPLALEFSEQAWAEQMQRPSANSSRSYGFPHYSDWDAGQKSAFESICGPTMARLGYSV